MTSGACFVILTGDVDGNLGDSAILAGIVAVIRENEANARIAVVSDGTVIARGVGPVDRVPKGLRGLIPLFRAIAQSRLVVVGGGGLFQDDDSLIKMPYWAARCLMARVFNRRIVGCSLGVGPLRAVTSRVCARAAFLTMTAISVRDEAAAGVARLLTDRPVVVTPDPALLCKAATDAEAEALLRQLGICREAGPLIGISPRRFYPIRRRWIPHVIRSKLFAYDDPVTASHQLIERYASALTTLIKRHGARLLFMPTYNVTHEADDDICRAIQKLLPESNSHLIEVTDPSLFKAITRKLAVMIGGRMHPVILAASSGTAVVGLAYNPKFYGFFEAIGQQRFLIPVEEFVDASGPQRLVEAVEAAMSDQPELTERIFELTEKCRICLTSHFSETSA